MPLANRLSNFIKQNHLFDDDDRILAAVSGGIDSTTLLDLLISNGYQVAIAHCNFGLRGEESDGDEMLVKMLADKYVVPSHFIRFDTEQAAAQAGESIQMTARRLRYDWFNHLCNEYGYRYIAIAHNADDAAETFFLNLTRGTGVKGLTGIKPKAGRVVRPLLCATRAEIEEYASKFSIQSRHDSSNSKDKYSRNRIRLNVIPELKKINPSFSQTMLENMARLQMVEDLINQEVNLFKQKTIQQRGEEQHISINDLLLMRHAKLLLYEYLNHYGFNSSQVDGIYKSAVQGEPGRRFYTHSHVLERDRNTLIIYPKKEGETAEILIGKDCSAIDYPFSMVLNTFEKPACFTPSKESFTAMLDSDLITFPLTLRKWRKGDEFYPLGMAGKKKLSDFFIDIKLPLHEKENQWLVCSNNQIIWVVGHRIDNRFKIADSTKSILKISISQV